MNPALRGKTFRGEQVAYGLSSGFPVKLDFLANARQMVFPCVRKMTAIFAGSVTAGGGGSALGADAAKLFDQVKFSDEAEMIRASGAMLRLLRQIELGSKAVDPGDIAALGTNANYEYRMEFHFRPLDTRATRPRDFDVPLEHFLDGGELTWNSPAATPTNWPAAPDASWKVRWEMEVEDGRVRELKSRRRVFEQVMQNQDFEYAAGGQVRNAIIGSKLTNTGYTDLSSFTTIYSRSLDLPPNFVVNGLREEYRMGSDAIGANDNFLAATPTAIAMVWPHRFQKIGRMISVKTFHIDLLAAAPANARLLLDMVVNRTPNQSALQLGYPDPGALAIAIKQHGWVQGEASNFPVRGSNLELSNHLPIRIRPSGNG